ncbi:MAG TPA: hypothetical protein VHW23_43200 [Kofleriaceae bacterium]|jgi:hypothetical protein|nr:hypothetical protein [Kofleriaceae bacterium]
MADDEARVRVDRDGNPIPVPPPSTPGQFPTLNTAVSLTVGQLFYRDAKGNPQQCMFQFNPTEMERSRNIAFTRSRTGNILEEPRVGGRNSAKRKQTRKPESWDMSVTLRFDAAYGMVAWTQHSPLPKTPATAALPADPAVDTPTFNPLAAKFKTEIQRIDNTIQFFEQIAEPQPFVSEHEKIANAEETPPPPYVTLAFGQRAWQCAVKSVRIKEEDYTPDLYPRRFEVTLSLEIIETVRQNADGKGTRR